VIKKKTIGETGVWGSQGCDEGKREKPHKRKTRKEGPEKGEGGQSISSQSEGRETKNNYDEGQRLNRDRKVIPLSKRKKKGYQHPSVKKVFAHQE